MYLSTTERAEKTQRGVLGTLRRPILSPPVLPFVTCTIYCMILILYCNEGFLLLLLSLLSVEISNPTIS